MKKLMLAVMTVTLVAGTVLAESNNIPLIGSKAPSVKAQSTDGKITFPDDFGTSWKILFSHPADFTPVCTSELLELAYLQPAFNKLGVKVAVISTDNVAQHNMWKAHLEEINYKNRGKINIQFPLMEDPDGVLSRQYGMLHEPTSTNRDIRGVFIIDDKNVVRAINFYPVQVGRNMEEVVRLVEALQSTDRMFVYTPANWEQGDDYIVPYFPYTKAEVASNPEIKDQYYQVSDRLWFKKANQTEFVQNNDK
ncbi:redoxin domain-containing protein [Maribellus sp. YY47]|uniref:redoxin domain-containing protein n=1 Tax=Maribellus sp. YY47 TaxID=2929486 RepID=UPI0020019725|nr:redoxin domain-containing protein [Maribellus sp. YY47]MCK3685822.1 redoxin domain-containing protein [Maribellus sp. YY47]